MLGVRAVPPSLRIKTLSIIELSLGVAIGAITFTGSVIAFAKLNGNMSGAPIILPARHLINVGLALGLVFLIGILIGTNGARNQTSAYPKVYFRNLFQFSCEIRLG